MKLRPLAGLLVIIGLFSAGIGLGKEHGFSFSALFEADSKAPPGEFPVMDPSVPTKIVIPAIGVSASIHGVGTDKDGSVATPSLNLRNEAGWFKQGPSPGQFGPAIIVGHVDTKDKPAVFHRLRELQPGARIEVARRDRQVAIFEVNSVEQFGKERLPVPRVYQDFSRPALRLITCGGAWVGGETGYADNVIVFASLISSRKA
jgi:sortase (surface protein transpeptidase)